MQLTPQLQLTLQQQMTELRDIHTRLGLDTNELDELEPKIARFGFYIPLLGAFSGGKSSLLNALLEDNLLPVDITPETTLPIELRHAPEHRLIAHLADGQQATLQAGDLLRLRELYPASLLRGGRIEALLPHPLLQNHPQLIFMDLPGWDEDEEGHDAASAAYVQDSLAYILVVSVEEGTLRERIQHHLRDFALDRLPVVLIITKADKRPMEDAHAVAEHVQHELSALIGRSPMATLITSARKGELDKLPTVLDDLQRQAEQTLISHVIEPYLQYLRHIAAKLRLEHGRDSQEAAHITAMIAQLDPQAAQDVTPGPRIDIARVQALIEYQKELLKDIREDAGDIADEIADAVWDEFETQMEDVIGDELSFDFSSYHAQALSLSLSNSFDESFERIFLRRMHRLSKELTEAGLSDTDFGYDFYGLQGIRKGIKLYSLASEWVEEAINRAKPGFLGALLLSRDPASDEWDREMQENARKVKRNLLKLRQQVTSVVREESRGLILASLRAYRDKLHQMHNQLLR